MEQRLGNEQRAVDCFEQAIGLPWNDCQDHHGLGVSLSRLAVRPHIDSQARSELLERAETALQNGFFKSPVGLKLNQGPTLALLEAMGVSERERQALQLWRALGVGATVLFVALPIGIVMAWLLCTVVNPRAFGWSLQLTLSPNAFLTPLVTGLIAIAVTSLLPTPRERLGEIGEGG